MAGKFAARQVGYLILLAGVGVLAATLMLVRPWQPRPGQAASFTLQASTGDTVTPADLAGRPYLVFFGFTHCPDICPTTLTQISEAFDQVGPAWLELRAYFVTVDPERDTREVLASYLSSFDRRIIGVTGSRAEIDGIIRRFRVIARKVPTREGYVYDHSTAIYMIDAAGESRGLLNIERPASLIAADIKALAARP